MKKDSPARRIPRAQSCTVCHVREYNEWCDLTCAEVETLDRHKVVMRSLAGETVYHQGNPATAVYTVVEGTVALRRTDEQGRQVLVALIHDTGTFGYADCVGGEGYSTSAEVLEESTLCQIDKSTLFALVEANPRLARRFQMQLVRDFNSVKEHLLQQAWLPVRSRLAHLLLRLKDEFGDVLDDGRVRLRPPLTRQDMADLVCTRPETVVRTLNAMQRDGVLLHEGPHLVIGSLEVLQHEAEAE